MQLGFPLLLTAKGGESGVRQELFEFIVVWSFAPSAGGRRLLPGAAWRRGRASPRSLVTSPGRSRSSAGWVRASLGL